MNPSLSTLADSACDVIFRSHLIYLQGAYEVRSFNFRHSFNTVAFSVLLRSFKRQLQLTAPDCRSRPCTIALMIQEVLVSPTAKLDISKLLKSSPSPSPPPPLSTSRPSISRSYSIPATDPARGAETSPTSSTSSYPTVPSISSSSSQATRQPGFGGQASRLIPTSSSKRTASTSPQESRQANKKPTRQWSKSDSEELLRLRGDNMKWEDVARHFPGRTSTACRLRYQNYLERKYDWTDEKKAKLARLYDRYVIRYQALGASVSYFSSPTFV